jgi:hypothetical protein
MWYTYITMRHELTRVVALDGTVWHVRAELASWYAALPSAVCAWVTPAYVAGLAEYDRLYWRKEQK